MWLLGGLATGLAASLLVFPLVRSVTANLPPRIGLPMQAGLILAAMLAGFLAGASIWGRVRRTRYHLSLFSGMAGAVAGGMVGLAFAVGLTGAYLYAFSTWPQDRFDQALMVLAYPVFAVVGLSVGALPGFLFGLLCGAVARVTAIGR